ncbi:MAG: His/Gly/Thr/Pro-type tRNA ligase C-terminal domain-containing protein, partial [Chloroflexi bacterium]|nr:His/Gly/Thr/Pro-type tRNA ligase C-terminal domain-containing protein [Chloroflexota bacterium]
SGKMGATFLDRDGAQKPILMGCYGIGLGRLLAAAIEQHHDEHGIVWPPAIAPFQVQILGLNMGNETVADACARVYAELETAGFEVLFDDRTETAGVKFKDADLIGTPLRVTISQRSVAAGGAEVTLRRTKEPQTVPFDQLVTELRALLSEA